MISKNYRRQIMQILKTDLFDSDDQGINEINENRLNGTTSIMDDPKEWKGHQIEDPPRQTHPHLCITEQCGVLTISVSVVEPDTEDNSDIQL
jgi:hypothetical protein